MLEEIHPLPSNPRQAKTSGRKPKKKVPHHLTSAPAIEMIAASDEIKKKKQVKDLEKEMCKSNAVKKLVAGDRMRAKAEREGDPMRPTQYKLDALKKVYGEDADVESLLKPDTKKKKVTERTTPGKKAPRYPPPPKMIKKNPKL